MKDFVCNGCGKTFSHRRNRKYCSADCYRNSLRPNRRTGEIVQCSFCGKEIYKTKGLINKHVNLFCNTECSNAFQKKDKLEFVCKICGKKFYWSKSRIKTNSPKYCTISCRNKDEEYLYRASSLGNLAQANKTGLNKLEQAGRSILESLNIEFYEQVSINEKFVVDVVIPKYNIVVQWDGDYWHGHISKLKSGIPDTRQRKRMALDISQDKYLSAIGYTVLRFWEHDVTGDILGKTNIVTSTINKYLV